mgnify:FL=1
MYENRFIKNTACPKCREDGKDKHGDNLATYSDGSSYCWSCGFSDMGNSSITRFLDKRNRTVPSSSPGVVPKITLPDDSVTDYPDKALHWIEQYELNRTDLLHNGVLWSDRECRLLFPFLNDGELLGWQGRLFSSSNTNDSHSKKWYSRGKLDMIYHIMFNGRVKNHPSSPLKLGKVGHAMNDATRRIVLVEDVVSALKVSKVGIDAMPLFGVNIKQRWPKIRLLGYSEALLWLDPDMHIKIIKESRVGCLNGITTHAILSTKDPKCHTLEEIRTYIGETQ